MKKKKKREGMSSLLYEMGSEKDQKITFYLMYVI